MKMTEVYDALDVFKAEYPERYEKAVVRYAKVLTEMEADIDATMETHDGLDLVLALCIAKAQEKN